MSEHSRSETTTAYGSAHDLPSFIEMRRQLAGFGVLSVVFMREKRGKIAELKALLIEMADLVDAFYEVLGANHWTFNDWMSPTTIREILRDAVDVGDAEQRPIKMFQDPEATKFHLLRLRNVEGLRERRHLLVRAREDYDAGRFDSCTLLLISVMDGFVNDFETDKRKGLAARDATEMVAWDSVTGHHLGLAHALKPFWKPCKKRTDEEVFEVHRHGIVHGTIVNYNNVVVATKAWNLLFAVVDWSVATRKKAVHDKKPPAPGWRETLQVLVTHARKRKAREEFVAHTDTAATLGFEESDVVIATRRFVDGWQKGQWARLIAVMPPQLVRNMRPGEAAKHIKEWFVDHEIADVDVDRVEYPRASVAEVRGAAKIDGTSARLRLRWVYYDSEGQLAHNGDDGCWRLAVIAPHSYLVDENDERLN